MNCVLFAKMDQVFSLKNKTLKNTGKMGKDTGKVREKSGNFVSSEKWEPWLCHRNVLITSVFDTDKLCSWAFKNTIPVLLLRVFVACKWSSLPVCKPLPAVIAHRNEGFTCDCVPWSSVWVWWCPGLRDQYREEWIAECGEHNCTSLQPPPPNPFNSVWKFLVQKINNFFLNFNSRWILMKWTLV